MKTTTLPSLRVTSALREAAESVLEQGETLSSFMEESVRLHIERRRAQRDFIDRGLASREEAALTGEYYAAEDVLKELDDLLAEAEARAAK